MIRETLEALFDYSVVPDGIAAEMREAAGHIRRNAQAAFIEAGMTLLKIKGLIDHGHFLAWIEPECGLKIRTAQRAMQVAQLVIEYVNLTYLPTDSLLLLASRSAPKPLRDEIIQRINAGNRPTAAEIKREFERARATTKVQREARQRNEQKPVSVAGQELSYSRVELHRVADMLVEKLGDHINEVVRVLETVTTVELAEALRERRPDLFDQHDEASAELSSSAKAPDEEAGICAPLPGTGSTEPRSPEVADKPAKPSPPSPDIEPPASDSSFESAHEPPGKQQQMPAPNPISDPLEDAYQAGSAEERARALNWVMWGHAHGEAPTERSHFLAQYLAATPAEQKAFRSRRVAEPTRKVA
jgi:hypothetical protein